MKCPNCEEEMRTVEVEYSQPPEIYVLDESTGRYALQTQDQEGEFDMDFDAKFRCGECGCELDSLVVDTFSSLIICW